MRNAASLLLVLALAAVPFSPAPAGENEGCSSTDKFLDNYLTSEDGRQPKLFWVTGESRDRAEAVLGHRFPGLRLRYWGEGERTLWIMDEIGKEMPITIGVVVDNDEIANITILEYRESRGGEVRYPFFTRQFVGLSLDGGKDNSLSGQIDGITGATLSVAAVRKVAILALLFHHQTPFSKSANQP